MRRLRFAVLCACLSLSAPLGAQPPGGSDRGSSRDGSDRGSSDRGGSDRGSRFGGGFGGPPGGGSFGGPPGGGGFGGPPGGGGFDPSDFLKRLDRNGNNAIDPDEMEGPARFMIERMARDNPSIRTDRPVPLDTIKQSFEKMRSGGSSSDSRDSSRDSSRDNRPVEPPAPMPLVPGFKVDKPAPSPIMGFGMTGELFDVAITEADLAEARERLQQNDRNKDGLISKEEMDGRWSGNPMDYDRNHDEKLSVSELAVRYARRRLEKESQAQKEKKTARRDDRRPAQPDPNAPPPLKSLKLPDPSKPIGVPEWFTDRNGDGQLEMSEYRPDDPWTDEKFGAFNHYDLNSDGLIVPYEAMSMGRQSTGGGMALTSTRPPDVSPEVAARNLSFAKRIVGKSDKNGNGAIDPDEGSGSIVDLRSMDSDGDGKVTVEEYANHLSRKSASSR